MTYPQQPPSPNPPATTAAKTYAPQLVGASIAIAYILAKPALRLNYADASAISDALVAVMAYVLPQATFWIRNHWQTDKPAWNGWLKGAAALGAVSLAGVLVWRFL